MIVDSHREIPDDWMRLIEGTWLGTISILAGILAAEALAVPHAAMGS